MYKKINAPIMHLLTPMCILTAVSGFAQEGRYELTVMLPAVQAPAKAYMVSDLGFTNQRVLDSAEGKSGVFHFTGTADNPVKTEIVIDHTGKGLKGTDRTNDMLVVYLEQAHIVVKGKDSIRYATVKGSALNADYARYRAALAATDKAVKAVDAEYFAAPDEKRKDPAFMTGLQNKVKEIWVQRDTLKYDFIRSHPDSYFSLEALKELAGSDINKAGPLFDHLSERVRHTKEGIAFGQWIHDTWAVSIGAVAPDFVQPDVDGQPVHLSDFKGKYVLLDFWASWCGPCRGENPNVVKAFSKYKDKNFTVLSVSLDQPGKKAAWLAAIKADSLTWTQVSDLQFWNNAAAKLYVIKAIPQNFLIDPSGKIIAKNLRGEALEKKLADIFVKL